MSTQVEELIERLNELGRSKRVSLAGDGSCDVVYGDFSIQEVDNGVVLVPLEGSEEFS